MQNELTQYIAGLDRIFRAGNATEHTYRPALKQLLENMTGLTVTNEPKRIACGAPDYIVTRGEIPVGYMEAKDIGTDLDGHANREQFDRYKESLGNLVITDYLSFRFFQGGSPVASVAIGETNGKGISPLANQFETFAGLVHLFTGYEGLEIKTSEHLSKIMAAKARLMAGAIEQALDNREEGGNNSLDGQLNGFREVLINDIKHKEFADIYAQTIAYGMFAAGLHHEDKTNGKFTRSKAAQLIPPSNPFLRKLFQYIAGYDLDERICWVVNDLADLFNYVDTAAIVKEFDKIEHDPVVHFYETFLGEYDPALRKSRGVWYTPQPVVQFIVQAVDDILKQEFGLPQGLADSSFTEKGLNSPAKDAQPPVHRVQILDPAAGTGTFLSGVVSHIYKGFKNQQGLWSGYANEHLIPRINGFEILMASYAMAHLKLDMLLQKTGVRATAHSPRRLRIYLTNSLEEARAKTEIPFAQWLSDEANEASHIKQDVPVMVVLGNPPYSISSQNRGKWMQGLMEDYKEGLNERNIQPLSDDYIKFIRYGQYFINKNGGGILAYISNNSFIDGLIHRQMRKQLLDCFDTIYILNLHGNAKKKETTPGGSKDENVFDIQQGVSINIFVKTGRKKAANKQAKVFHYDLYGKRKDKYSTLLENSLASIKWEQVNCHEPYFFFVPKNEEGKEEYEKGFSVQELFPVNTSGIKTHDDAKLVGFSSFPANNQRYAYRPFDIRHINYDLKKVKRHRYNVMQHFINGENVGLITCRQQSTFDFQHVFLSNNIADMCSISLQTKETGYVFPLYLYPKADKLFTSEKRKPNLDPTIVKKISQQTGLSFVEEKGDNHDAFAPIDLLDYIYALLHSLSYRERYKEFLKTDFPRVPYPQDAAQFRTLATLGAKLRRLHLMEDVEPLPGMATYPKEGSNKIEKLTYEPNKGASPGIGKVRINDAQYFDNVPSEAWEFYTGGYQPAQKWLKDRKGRTLRYDEIRHYQRIVAVLWETAKVMREVDGTE